MSEKELLSKKVFIFILAASLLVGIVGLMLITAGMNTAFGDYFYNDDIAFAIFSVISYIGDDLVYIIVGASAFYIYDKRFAKNMMFALLGSSYLNSILKDIFQDPRPSTNIRNGNPVETGNGFPSGHAQGSTTTYGYMAFHVQTNYAEEKWYSYIPWILVVLIYLISISRQIIGVHDVEDIVGGILIGITFLLIYIHLEPIVSERINTMVFVNKLSFAIAIPVAMFIIALAVFPTSQSDYGMVCGAFTGLAAGYVLENEKIQYDPTTLDNKQRIINLAIGLAITLVLYIVLSLIDVDIAIWRYFKYLIISLVAIILVPWIFTKIQK